MMTNTKNKQAVKKEENFSLIGYLLAGVFQLIAWVLLGYGLFILIAMLIVFLQGNSALNNLLAGQVHFLHNKTFILNPLDTAIKAARFVYLWIFVKTHILVLLDKHSFSTGYFLLDDAAKNLAPGVSKYGYALLTVAEILTVKTIALLFVLPLFLLMFLVGLVDGLVQRDLRRFGAGRENATVHRIARSYIFPTLGGCIFIYLVVPYNISPEIIFISFAVLFGYSVALTAKSWKKHGWFS